MSVTPRFVSHSLPILSAVGLMALLTACTAPPAPPTSTTSPEPAAPPSLVVDEAFAPALVNPGAGTVTCAALFDDGRAVIGGHFVFVNDTAHRYLAGLTEDGTRDASFATHGGPDGPVSALLALPDGSVLIGGHFRRFAGKPAAGLVCVRADGALDPQFRVPTRVNGPVQALALSSEGRIFVGGAFDSFEGEAVPGLVQLARDGTIDGRFRANLEVDGVVIVESIAPTGEGGALLACTVSPGPMAYVDSVALPGEVGERTQARLVRLRADGRVEPSFSPQQTMPLAPRAVFALPGGDFLVAGTGGALRIDARGAIDGRFRFSEQRRMVVQAVAALDDGRLVVGGDVEAGTTLAARLLVLGREGEVQARYLMPRDESHAFTALARNRAGRILAAGRVAPAADRVSFSRTANRVLLLDERLAEDRRFRAAVGGAGRVTAAVPHAGGSVTVGGMFMSGDALTGTGIMRLGPDGTPERRFRAVGTLDGAPSVLVPLVDGGVIAAGITTELIEITRARPVLRFRSDGLLDPTYAPDLPVNGLFTDAAVLRDGSVVLVGRLTGRVARNQPFANLVRLDASGRVDRQLAGAVPGWLPAGSGRILAAAGTSSGHLLVAGEFTTLQGQPRSCLARIGTGGAVDPGFVPETREFAVIAAVTVLEDQRIFIDGWARDERTGWFVRRFARLHSDGRRDAGFPPPAFDAASPVLAAPLADGTTLVLVHDAGPGAPVRFRFVRLDRDGTVMRNFDVALGNYVAELKLLPASDGSVLIAGDVPGLDDRLRHGLARLAPRP